MRLGNVLGGAAEGFKDTWTKVDEWRKEAEDRKARRSIQEAMVNAPKPGETVLGSKNPAQDFASYAAQQGVPDYIADQGIEAVRAWQETKAGSTSPETNLQPVTGQATEVAGSRVAALPVAPAAVAPDVVPVAAPDGSTPLPRVALTPPAPMGLDAQGVTKTAIGGADVSDSRASDGSVSFADPVGGRTMYTNRPRYATQADNLEYMANAYAATGMPEYAQLANTMRVQASALREQDRTVQFRQAEQTARRAMSAFDAGAADVGQELVRQMFENSELPITPVFGTRDGKPVFSIVYNDTGGTVVSPPVEFTTEQMRGFLAANFYSSEGFAAYSEQVTATQAAAIKRAQADREYALDERRTKVYEEVGRAQVRQMDEPPRGNSDTRSSRTSGSSGERGAPTTSRLTTPVYPTGARLKPAQGAPR